MPHAVYSEKEVLDLKVDVHYTPKVSLSSSQRHVLHIISDYN